MRGIVAIILLIVIAIGGNVPPVAYAAASTPTAEPQMVDFSAHQLTDMAMNSCCDETDGMSSPAGKTCSMDCHYIAPLVVQSFRSVVQVQASAAPFAIHPPNDVGFLRPPISG